MSDRERGASKDSDDPTPEIRRLEELTPPDEQGFVEDILAEEVEDALGGDEE